jgi:hypothetical protein
MGTQEVTCGQWNHYGELPLGRGGYVTTDTYIKLVLSYLREGHRRLYSASASTVSATAGFWRSVHDLYGSFIKAVTAQSEATRNH